MTDFFPANAAGVADTGNILGNVVGRVGNVTMGLQGIRPQS
jgi:hypothetical protein